ncbi:hypothetical protein D8I30_08205 [Brevundimonas naejangsanensis]|uniref:Uncharacterized protein n=1 Tax=Brevundimonas naejangsanensis TaxID=588932 RepID=A0A494RN37_9CAUL|nr:hypothetical protein [Brevundimonas naejangsanensis]AYG96343.1 hypothetical protein D8I30_08205 [Brevundimonas naejangsanensis]
MFEFGRDLRRLFEKARDSDDLGWLELIGAGLVEVEARQQSTDAGRVSCARPHDAALRAAALWREHARRCGSASSIERAEAAGRDAATGAVNDDQAGRAALDLAQTAMLAFDLHGGPERLTAALALLAGLPPARRADTVAARAALHARLRTRQGLLSGRLSELTEAAALLDAALSHAKGGRTAEDDLRMDRAAVTLEAGLIARDPRLLDQAGRDLRALVEAASPEQRPLSRARALALCATGMAALAAVAGDAAARDQAQALFDAAAQLFTPDHSPLDWAAIQVMRAERETLPPLVLAQAEALTEGGGLVLGALAHEQRIAQEAARAGAVGDLSALFEIEGSLRRRLMRPSVSATPLDWAAEQIGLARVALARARWTGEPPRAVGLMLAEAALTAREHGASALAERAERLTPRPQVA